MRSATLVVVTGHLFQAVCAAMTALVLLAFYRHYRRRYLWHWAWSWWSFCIYVGAAAVAQWPPPLAMMQLASAVSLAGGYAQIALLVIGTWELARGEDLPGGRARQAVGAMIVLALSAILVSVSLPHAERLVVRFGLRSFLAGLAFLVASAGVLGRFWRRGLGPRLLGIAFLIYGLEQFHYSVIMALAFFAPAWNSPFQGYMTVFDFLLQMTMAMGMVLWLLDEEHRRVSQAARQLEHLAYHDTLTGLPNRSLLLESLRAAVGRAELDGRRVALLFLDIDRFKVINDSLGHEMGDRLLQGVAGRLRSLARPGDMVARIGNDEFVMLLPDLPNEAEALLTAERLLGAVRVPFVFDGRDLELSASLGISRFPKDGSGPEDLLKTADLAMSQAKARGGDTFQIHTASMDARARERLALESDLRRALGSDELVLFYQPILDARTRRIEGAEALVRWRHPDRGLLRPEHFLWIVEPTGLADRLDFWVLGTACREVGSWQSAGARVRAAVNLSARTLRDPELPRRIEELLEEGGFPPAALEIEISEVLAVQNAEVTLDVLRSLKDLGVRVALDDFGTGYSLPYLRSLPIDTLKIDVSFVRALGEGPEGIEIPAAMMTLARSLGIRVVAEGVENERQWDLLRSQGCDEVQGHLFSPPLSAPEFRDLLLRRRGFEGHPARIEPAGA